MAQTRGESRRPSPDYGWLGPLLDRTSPVPLYYQLAQQLENAIDTGRLVPGDLLGNEIVLGDKIGISRPTVRRAIARLADKGLLIRRRGVGTVIAPTQVNRPIGLTSLFDDLTADGSRPRTEVLSVEITDAAPMVAGALRIPEGKPVLEIKRLRFADNKPIALMRNQLPVGILRGRESSLSEIGLYQLIRQVGIDLRLASQRISAKTASTREAHLLRVPRGSAMVTMSRTAYDHAGRPVEHGSHVYPASRYSFEMSLVNR